VTDRLHAELAGSGPPLLLLHGFTGSLHTWDDVRPALEIRARTLAVDLIGHGRSLAPPEPQRYSMDACVADVLRALDAHGIEQAAVLGYSMGGRVALRLTLAAPRRVSRLILESTSPGLEDPVERAARVASDEALADTIERDGLATFLAGWEQLPLLALDASVPAERRARLRAERLANTPVGLANSLRGMGAGRQPPVWDRLAELRLRVLLIVGERDATYRAIAERLGRLLPRADVVVVPGAGHTVHIDQPVLFVDAVLKVIDTLPPTC
jgi:2-succinyl-6-hydroxy-2,4-cyclohexadiene-1-carboxylate synthase